MQLKLRGLCGTTVILMSAALTYVASARADERKDALYCLAPVTVETSMPEWKARCRDFFLSERCSVFVADVALRKSGAAAAKAHGPAASGSVADLCENGRKRVEVAK